MVIQKNTGARDSRNAPSNKSKKKERRRREWSPSKSESPKEAAYEEADKWPALQMDEVDVDDVDNQTEPATIW